MSADARRFVRASRERYDVIVSDNFHPARSGSGSLYTVEHFKAVRDRLAEDGLFCQWLPLHQLDLDTLRSIVRSFLAAYPHGWAMLATNSLDTPVLGLVGRRDANLFDAGQVRERLAAAALPRSPAGFGITDDLALLGGFIAGPRALARFAANAPLNTDDHPVVAYRAPRITYVPDSLPRDRLIALLREVEISPDELLGAAFARHRMEFPARRVLGRAQSLHRSRTGRAADGRRAAHAGAGARTAPVGAAHQPRVPPGVRSVCCAWGPLLLASTWPRPACCWPTCRKRNPRGRKRRGPCAIFPLCRRERFRLASTPSGRNRNGLLRKPRLRVRRGVELQPHR